MRDPRNEVGLVCPECEQEVWSDPSDRDEDTPYMTEVCEECSALESEL